MAGASPTKTQQLFDRSLRHRSTRQFLICTKGNLVLYLLLLALT